MISNTQRATLLVTSLASFAWLAALGCSPSNHGKDACMQPADCIDGFVCVNQTCVDATTVDGGVDGKGPGPGNGGDPDASSGEFGTVESITVTTTGVAAIPERTLLGATATAGNLGCALVGDLAAAPGGGAAVVYAAVRREGGDHRCPDGVYAITNPAGGCRPDDPFHELSPGCGIYRRWDAAGTLSAQRSAIGGHVAVQDIEHGASSHTCNVEISLSFTGGVTIGSSVSFDYNPFAPDERFCVH